MPSHRLRRACNHRIWRPRFGKTKDRVSRRSRRLPFRVTDAKSADMPPMDSCSEVENWLYAARGQTTDFRWRKEPGSFGLFYRVPALKCAPAALHVVVIWWPAMRCRIKSSQMCQPDLLGMNIQLQNVSNGSDKWRWWSQVQVWIEHLIPQTGKFLMFYLEMINGRKQGTSWLS